MQRAGSRTPDSISFLPLAPLDTPRPTLAVQTKAVVERLGLTDAVIAWMDWLVGAGNRPEWLETKR